MDDDLAQPPFGRHNASDGITFTRSARKHRVSYADMRAVVRAPCRSVALEPIAPHRGRRRLYLGVGRDGTRLEVVAILHDDGSRLVIHAMPLRAKYRAQFEEG